MLQQKEVDSEASVGVLVDGPFAVAHTLSISWGDAETTAENWAVLRLCNRWQLTADYEEDLTTLYLKAWSKPVPVSPRSVLMASYWADWEMDNPEGIRFFVKGAKDHGYFVLIPATKCQVDTNHRPIVAFLGRGENVS